MIDLDEITATLASLQAALPFHDQDHIRQILDAVQRHYLSHMTDTMRTALTG